MLIYAAGGNGREPCIFAVNDQCRFALQFVHSCRDKANDHRWCPSTCGAVSCPFSGCIASRNLAGGDIGDHVIEIDFTHGGVKIIVAFGRYQRRIGINAKRPQQGHTARNGLIFAVTIGIFLRHPVCHMRLCNRRTLRAQNITHVVLQICVNTAHFSSGFVVALAAMSATIWQVVIGCSLGSISPFFVNAFVVDQPLASGLPSQMA